MYAGLGIGICDRRRARRDRGIDQCLRRNSFGRCLRALRNGPILTEGTTHVAAHETGRKDPRIRARNDGAVFFRSDRGPWRRAIRKRAASFSRLHCDELGRSRLRPTLSCTDAGRGSSEPHRSNPAPNIRLNDPSGLRARSQLRVPTACAIRSCNRLESPWNRGGFSTSKGSYRIP